MKVSKQESSASQPGAAARLFEVEGRIQRDQQACMPGELKLMAYVFDKAGHLLGSDALDAQGMYRVQLRLVRPIDVTLLVGPAGIPDSIRQSDAFVRDIADTEWKQDKERFVAHVDALLPVDIWFPWFPRRICVSGHVRKIVAHDGVTDVCPVPLVKVEIFDVDRESCLWPGFRRWWEYLLDRPVIRLPDLLRDPPVPIPPFPGPDPAPDLKLELARPRLAVAPLQPALAAAGRQAQAPQAAALQLAALQLPETDRVAEARVLDPALASRLGQLTVTSRIPPWLVFPNCFYSRELVCETTTDCNGFFNCCFNWWPFHVRHGRLRFDTRPDIIIRVTQVIDGVPTVIYMDPYTSTRWNQSSTHIDLYLDDPDVECGASCAPQPSGTTVFYTRVGNDYVYNIDQATGTFHGSGLSNVAYGATLNIQAVFGEALSHAGDPHYYRLSVGPGIGAAAGPFTPLTAAVADTRVHKTTLASESYALGPQVVNGQPALYEVRNTDDYYWFWQDLIGHWATPDDVPDEGIYTVRLEVFDKNGVKLTSAFVDYRNGTVAPPGPLPPMADHCDLVLQVDNVAPALALSVPAATSDCGVVPFAKVPFSIFPSANQANGRLYSWRLAYVMGLASTETTMLAESDPAGLAPLPRPLASTIVTSAPFTDGLATTCAFALVMDAWALIRNGYGFVYQTRLIKAIAVEKCPPCEELRRAGTAA